MLHVCHRQARAKEEHEEGRVLLQRDGDASEHAEKDGGGKDLEVGKRLKRGCVHVLEAHHGDLVRDSNQQGGDGVQHERPQFETLQVCRATTQHHRAYQ